MGLHQAGNQYQWGFPGPILGPVIFNDFINELDTGIRCTLMKFVNNTQLGKALWTPLGVEWCYREIRID